MRYPAHSSRRLLIPFLFALAVIARSESSLSMEGTSLSGKHVVLPQDVHGKIAFLLIGFSKKGGDACGLWQKRLKKDFAANQNYAIYPIAVLEDAPRFVRGMIQIGMRKNTPKDEQDRFVILVQGEKDLERVVGYSVPNDPYLLLIDQKGEIRWRGHGPFQEQDYSPLRDAAMKLASQ